MNAKKMKAKKIPERETYYNVDVEPRDLDLDDAADCIALLVSRFVRLNVYAMHADALVDTAPNDWARQVNAAAHYFEEKLEDLANEVTKKLHDGEFARTSSEPSLRSEQE